MRNVTPVVQYRGPMEVHGIYYPHVQVELLREPPGFNPTLSGRWRCSCGWQIEYGLDHTPSMAPSPEYDAESLKAQAAARYHAERCKGGASDGAE